VLLACDDGCSVGLIEGITVGEPLGLVLGSRTGGSLGRFVGLGLGLPVGPESMDTSDGSTSFGSAQQYFEWVNTCAS
jgi:hypothetical protein